MAWGPRRERGGRRRRRARRPNDAGGETRTHTPLRAGDFKSPASTRSATPAGRFSASLRAPGRRLSLPARCELAERELLRRVAGRAAVVVAEVVERALVERRARHQVRP